MNEIKQLFSKIKTNEEKITIFKGLVDERSPIICKGTRDLIIKMAPIELNTRNEIICKLSTGEIEPTHSSEIVTCFVVINNEKYYFQTQLSKVGSNWNLSLPEDLYHLQRRQNYRLKIPSNYSSQLVVQEWNRNRAFFKLSIRDISIGGCAVIVTSKNPAAQIGTEVIGKIEISSKEPIYIIGQIKHMRPAEGLNSFLVGIEFNLKAVPGLERQLFSLTLDLYRELLPLIKVS